MNSKSDQPTDCAEREAEIGSTGSFSFATNDTVDFQRDATNTSILVDNGDYYPVNTIKAIEENGTITIMELVSSGTVLYSNINHQNVYINDAQVGGTVNNVVNELNALFTVMSDQSHIVNDLINDALEFLEECQQRQQMDTSEALELIERLASIDPLK